MASPLGSTPSEVQQPNVDSNATLTQSLVLAARSAPSSAQATLQLYNAVTALLSPLLNAQSPGPSQGNETAQYLEQRVFPALALSAAEEEAGEGAEAAQDTLKDTILDVVWQLDQSIDAGALRSTALAPTGLDGAGTDTSMEVDIPTGTPAALTAQEQATLERSARSNLASFVSLLMATSPPLLPRQAVLTRLEAPFLALLKDGQRGQGLIGDQHTYGRIEARARTALFYKQQKFNLLREESEGFSKLVVELLTSLGPSANPNADEDDDEEFKLKRRERAREEGERVKSLIGNFDLDPDRTLDLILDVFSDQLVGHHQFFLDFLTASPWAPRSPSGEGDKKGKSKQIVDVGLENDEGKSSIAQVLGFKFGYYQMETTHEPTPTNLYLLAALLIYHNFVKLADLWPHLSPTDAHLSTLDALYRSQQEALARSVGGANALAMAGALVDDDAPSSAAGASKSAASADKKKAEGEAAKKDPPNQKLGLLKAMLSLGDVAHSMFVLSQWPVLVSMEGELADLLLRLVGVSLEGVYKEKASISRGWKESWREEMCAEKSKYKSEKERKEELSSGKEKGTAGKERWLTGQALPSTSVKNLEAVFFFSRWRERIPQAGDFDEALEVLEKLWGPVLGVWWSRDFGQFSRVCRIIRADLLETPETNPRLGRWFDFIRTALLPATSLLEHHTPAALELWSVLSLLPIERRFALYGEWKDSLYRRIPALAVRKAEAERDVKSILRRLSTENVKQLGKTFAKIAHTNPTIIFAVALNQVQSYDNLIVPVVDAARYLTELGYDVLTYSLLDALSSGKSKTKEDGTSVALWLQGLATFAGQLYRRWASMAPSLWIVLQYLVNQLASGNSKDLVILRELISRMTGIEPFADLSDAQVLSLAGGRVLRSEVFYTTEITQATKRLQATMVVAAKDRLTLALKRSKLAMPLLVNIALQRKACTATEAHLKSLGALYDQNHAVLFQYMELLTAISEPDDLAAMVPPAAELVDRYGLDTAIAFDIGRPKLRLAMKAHDEQEALASEQRKKANVAARLARERAEVAAPAVSSSTPGSPVPTPTPAPTSPAVDVGPEPKAELEAGEEKEDGKEDVKMEEVKPESDATAEEVPAAEEITTNGDVAMVDAAAAVARPESPVPKAPWHPGLADEITRFNEILPADVQSQLGTPFFVTYWQLTLYDVIYPKDRYDAEMLRCRVMQREASTSTTLKPEDKDRFVKNMIELASKLMDEAVKHQSSIRGTRARLAKEAKMWFPNTRSRAEKDTLIKYIYQYCIEPRARLSLPDAHFAYQFIKKMHILNTPGFYTLMMLDKIFTSAVGPLLFACSENEARNFARFLFDLLTDVSAWYTNEQTYRAEAIGANLQGFARNPPKDPAVTPTEFVTHERFRSATKVWHSKMSNGFIASFESGEYMHIKNSILVLTKLAPVFPIEYATGIALEKSIAELLAVEKREDLTILAQGYKAVISKRRKHWADQPAKVDSPTPVPAATSSTSAAASPRATPAPTSIPARPSLSTNPSSVASTTVNGASVPTGPKHGLPSRPGQGNASPVPVRPTVVESKLRSEASAMDVDKPIPTVISTSRPTPTEPPRPSEATSRNSHPSLPARPGVNGTTPTNGPSSAAEKLRQEALGSRNSKTAPAARAPAATMDPPPAPSASSSRRPGDLPTIPTAPRSSNTARDERRDGDRRDDRRDPAASSSRPPSRPPSPRGSDSGRRARDSRGGESDRERDRPARPRSRERSVESAHSSSRGSRADRPRESSRSTATRDEKERGTSSRSDRPSDRSSGGKDEYRSTYDGRSGDRDRDRRDDRTRRLDEDSKGRSRDPRDEHKGSSSSSRRDEDRRRDDDRRRGDERKESLSTSQSRPRDDRDGNSTSKAPAGPRAERDLSSSSRDESIRPLPTAPGVDRLRPAPALRSKEPEASPKATAEAPKIPEKSRDEDDKSRAPLPPPTATPSALPASIPSRPANPPSISIRGGGAGVNRLYGSLTGDKHSSSSSDRRGESSSSRSRSTSDRDHGRDSRDVRDDRDGRDGRERRRHDSRDHRRDDDDRGDGRKRGLVDRLDSDPPQKRVREDRPSSSMGGTGWGPNKGRR